MRAKSSMTVLVLLGAAGGCPTSAPQVNWTMTAAESSSTDAAPTTGEATSTGSTGDGTTEGEADASTTCSFVCEADMGLSRDCDPWLQDCPAGEKCVPYAADGGSSWNALKCVPVMEDPAQPGEPCFVVGNGVSGIDNCAFGAICWDTDAENQGTCVAQCIGSPEWPTCAEPGFICPVHGDGTVTICLPTCDPLAPACPDPADMCIPYSNQGFVCVLDTSGAEGQAFDECEYENACDAGLYCEYSQATGCSPNTGCCLPFCATDAPNTCPGQELVCTPWFSPGEAPAGYETVGLCRLPE